MKQLYVIIVVLCLIPIQKLTAQQNNNYYAEDGLKRPWALNISGGTSVFFGDVKQLRILPSMYNRNELRFVGLLGLERMLSNSFTLRGNLSYSHNVGTKRSINRHFQAFVYEGNLNLLFYPVNAIWGANPNRVANPYLQVGVGIVNYNSTLYALDNGMVIRTSGYGNGAGINGMTLETLAVGGLGVDFPLSEYFDLRLEISQHLLSSDEMDRVIGGFKYDMFNQITLGFNYRFGGSNRISSTITDSEEEIVPKPEIKKEPEKEWDEFNKVIEEQQETKPVIVEIIDEKTVEPEPEITDIPKKLEREYRVQILNNGRRPIDLSKLAARFHLDASEINPSVYNDMNIYTVGSFETYEEAVAARDILKTKHSVYDAFIVPFVEGKRVAKMPE